MMAQDGSLKYYVTHSGGHGASNFLPEGAHEIDAQTYQLLEDNPALVMVEFINNTVRIALNLPNYKAAAKEKVRALINRSLPDGEQSRRIQSALLVQAPCFHEGEMLRGESVLKELLAKRVALENDLLYIQHKYLKRIDSAVQPEDVDRSLEALDKTVGTLL